MCYRYIECIQKSVFTTIEIMKKNIITFFLSVLIASSFVSGVRAKDSTGPNLKTIIHRNPQQLPSDLSNQPINPRTVQNANSAFTNVQVGPNDSQQDETSIAIDPVNPLKAICSSNDFYCNYTGEAGEMRYFYTTNGGNTWSANCVPVPSGKPYDNPFDPSVAYDSRGNAYLCFGDAQQGNGGDYANCIYVAKSTDGGITFQTAVTVAANTGKGISGFGGTQPFYDKMYIACDNADTTSRFRDRIYVSWTDFDVSGTSNILSYSSDGGTTWSSPVSFSGGEPGQCSIPVVGRGGVLYVTWVTGAFGGSNSKANIFISRSSSGGIAFTNPIAVSSSILPIGIYDPTFGRICLPSKDSMRVATFPSIAVDNSTNPKTSGNVYVVWQGEDLNSTFPHAYLAISTNNGNNWTLPNINTGVNGAPGIIDQGNSGNDVFFPAVACDPTNGNISMVYYDSRNSQDNTGVDLYCSLSSDGGKTFNEFRVTDTTTSVYTNNQGKSGGYYWGDYQGVAAYGGLTLPCWWMELQPTYNDDHIFTAIIRVGPNAVSNLQATSHCNANGVTLSWTNPTTNTFGEPLTSFSLTINRNGTAIASNLPQTATNYIDTTAVSGTQYTYGVVVTSNGSTSQQVTSTLYAGGEMQLNPPTAFNLRPVTNGVEAWWLNPTQHIDGTQACDLHAIYFYDASSSTLIDSAIVNANDAGVYSSFFIPLSSTKIWSLYATAVSNRGSVYTASDTSGHFTSYTGAPVQNFSENFDNTPAPLFYTTGTWGISDSDYVSKPYCLSTNPNGKYARSKTTFCQLPPFIRGTQDSTLEFYHILLCGINTYGDLELSTNNGQSWKLARQFFDSSYIPDWHVNTLPVGKCTWVKEDIDLRPFSKIGDTLSVSFVLKAGFVQGDGWFIDNVNVDSAAPNYIGQIKIIPASFSLDQNYPNPFSPSTRISFTLPVSAAAHLDVYNALGEHIATLVDEVMNAGQYAVNFNASSLQSGVYFYTLRIGQYSSTRRMVLIK